MSNNPADWLRVQQHLWQQWQSMVAPAMSAASAAPFGNLDVNTMLRQFGIDSTPVGDPTNVFISLFKPWLDGATQKSGAETFSTWINQGLQAFMRATAGGVEPARSPFETLSAFMQGPLQLWKMQPPGGNGVGATPWSGMRPSEIAALADLPPLGVTREWELKRREVQRTVKDEIEASNALARQTAMIYQTAVKQFLKAVSRNDPADGEINTLRELYDFWIDIAEKVYREKVMTQQYAQTFGRYINASARRRKSWQGFIDDCQQAMNLPHRQELDALIKGQHDLRNEVRALGKGNPAEADVRAIADRLEALSGQVVKLSEASAKYAVPATTVEPRAVASDASTITPPIRRGTTVKRKTTPAKSARAASSTTRSKRPQAPDEFDIGAFGVRAD